MKKSIDWEAKKAQAVSMTDFEILGALKDIWATLPHADAMDREGFSEDAGGYYRDEASVFHREMGKRKKKAHQCSGCGIAYISEGQESNPGCSSCGHGRENAGSAA